MFAIFAIFALSCASEQPNTLTRKEKREGWVLLFDGKSFDGLRVCNGIGVPPDWVIEDGAMRVLPRAEKPPRADGGRATAADILYDAKKFRNFELSISLLQYHSYHCEHQSQIRRDMYVNEMSGYRSENPEKIPGMDTFFLFPVIIKTSLSNNSGILHR